MCRLPWLTWKPRGVAETMAAELQLDLGFADDDWFDTLVAINQRWLSSYARQHPSFGVSPSLLERNSIWMNTYFQRQRMITSPRSKKAKALIAQHQQTVLVRLRSNGGGRTSSEAEGSTALVDPVAALMFATSADRCPEHHVECLLHEALDLLQNRALRALAVNAGFAGCVFRCLTASTEIPKRVLTLRLLVLLAADDAAAVVNACKVAAHGQLWQPNMFIYTLQKRHWDNETICDLASKLLVFFSCEMPISSPISLNSGRHGHDGDDSCHHPTKPCSATQSSLPALVSPKSVSNVASPHRPTTTISSLYVRNASPYSRNVILPIPRPPPSATEQAKRSLIFSTPKGKAVAGDLKRRCLTPNIDEIKREPSRSDDLDWIGNTSPPKPLPIQKRPVALSEKYSWNPDCINSVSGFEWWWRSLPESHESLDPSEKLKAVTKAAVRLHTKGEWERAVELYLLALSMDVNDEVAFRLRVNLGCAYQVGQVHSAAEAEFRAALCFNSEDPYVRFKLGSALKELGKLDEAATAFSGVVHVYPQAFDALKQLENARERKLQQVAAEREKLARAREARSPSKPGRRFQSPSTPGSTHLPHIPKAPGSHRDPSGDSSAVRSVGDVESSGLLNYIEERSHEKRINLRAAFKDIDSASTGCIRITALVKLLSALCDVDESTFRSWLPHEAVREDANGVIHYGTLLDAVDKTVLKKRAHGSDNHREWIALVETIKLAEVGFYSSISCREVMSDTFANQDTSPAPCSVDGPCKQSGSEPVARDLGSCDQRLSQRVGDDRRPLDPSRDSIQLQIDMNGVEMVDGYHSVSARLNAKREKARQEAILRAERSRVVARKHQHCLKVLHEVAFQARRILVEKYGCTSNPTVRSENELELKGLTGDKVESGSVERTSQAVVVDNHDVQSSPELAGEVTPACESQEQGREPKEPASADLVVILLSERIVELAICEATQAVIATKTLAEIQSLASAASLAAVSAARCQLFGSRAELLVDNAPRREHQ